MFSKKIVSFKLISFIFLVFLLEYILLYFQYHFKLNSETIIMLISFTPGFALSILSLKYKNTRFNLFLFIFYIIIYTLFFLDIAFNKNILFIKKNLFILMFLGTIYIYIVSLVYSTDTFRFYKNFKKVKYELMLELIILIIGFIIQSKFNIYSSINMSIFIIIFSFITCITSISEEYGWRYFLQGHLQDIFGDRIGIFVLGIVWEIWHIPMYSILNIDILFIIIRFISTIGIAFYLGYLYDKTNNIFVTAYAHVLISGFFSFYSCSNNFNISNMNSYELFSIVLFIVFCYFFLFKKATVK